MLTPSRHHGGVALFYWESPVFAVEAIHQFGLNVIACHLETGGGRWYIVGCYLAPGYGATFWDVEAVIAERPNGTELIVAEDLNVDLERTGRRGQDEEIAAAVSTGGVEDLLVHFLQRQIAWNRDWRMWAMVRQGREVRTWTDYILGSNFWIFQNVAVWDLRHNSDHYIVLGCLKGAFPREQ